MKLFASVSKISISIYLHLFYTRAYA